MAAADAGTTTSTVTKTLFTPFSTDDKAAVTPTGITCKFRPKSTIPSCSFTKFFMVEMTVFVDNKEEA